MKRIAAVAAWGVALVVVGWNSAALAVPEKGPVIRAGQQVETIVDDCPLKGQGGVKAKIPKGTVLKVMADVTEKDRLVSVVGKSQGKLLVGWVNIANIKIVATQKPEGSGSGSATNPPPAEAQDKE
jgi:hypothetical protein